MNKEKALVNANMIIDYDFSLWKLLKNEYNGDFINKNLLSLSDDHVRMLLNDRPDVNPLSILLSDSISDENKDELYKEFMTTKKRDIINYIEFYENILFVIRRLQESSYTTVDILYNDDVEKEFLDKLVFNKYKKEEIDFDTYNAIFSKTTQDIKDNLYYYFGKNVYLAMTGYNCRLDKFNNIIFDNEFAKLVFKKININIIALYVFSDDDIILG